MAIFLNGEKRFDANPRGELTVDDAFERMDFVYENIEFCCAEGRLMDVAIFDQLESLGERVRANDTPPFNQVAELAEKIGSRYGFGGPELSDSAWVRRDKAGQFVIWIDRDKIVAESNKKLFG
ncbi:MAG: hypothetical protein KDB14_00890 [Planctomycetales bacterium]|nr:hypothetical protein [Planctomycetales bacterium]